MSLCVLHLIGDTEGASQAASLRSIEPSGTVASRMVGPYEPGPAARLDQTCQAAVRAFAGELEAARVDPVDVVVAHGWAVAPPAERLASRQGAALLICAQPPVIGSLLAELREWSLLWADGLLAPPGPGVWNGPQLCEFYQAAMARRQARNSHAGADATRTYDLAIHAGGIRPELIEALLLRLQKVVVLKGASRAEWQETSQRSRLALVGLGSAGDMAPVEDAVRAGCLPMVVGAPPGDPRALSVGESEVFESLQRLLSDSRALEGRLALANDAIERGETGVPLVELPAPTRALRVVLNHSGHVAEELRTSLEPLGWELRPLMGPGRDPLPAADLLVVLPYGDPRGALDAVRRAKRAGVPSAFWNVEDPRYFFDPELGPLVLAAAKQATATFSTTTQLTEEYRGHGVQVRYLPNYGREYFFRQQPREDSERTVDVLFLGTLTPERQAFLDAYRAALGPAVSLLVRDDVRDPGLLCELVGSARLGLAVGTMTDAVRPSGVLRGEGVTERLFDYPLAGTPVLSDVRRHLPDQFVDGQDLVVFRDTESAVAATRELLADSTRRRALVSSAREKVLGRHLGRHRLLEIVEVLATQPGTAPLLGRAAAAARVKLSGTPAGGGVS